MPKLVFLVLRQKNFLSFLKKLLFFLKPRLKNVEEVKYNVINVNLCATNTLCDKSVCNEHTFWDLGNKILMIFDLGKNIIS